MLSDKDLVISRSLQGSVLSPLLFLPFISDIDLEDADLYDAKIVGKILKYVDVMLLEEIQSFNVFINDAQSFFLE